MLVISRRIGESFVIGDDIVATIVDISGEKVILGVNAPKEVPIERLAADEKKDKSGVNKNGYGRQYGRSSKPPRNS